MTRLTLTAAVLLTAAVAQARAQVLLTENFTVGNNSVAQLQGRGWVLVNNSDQAVPPGGADTGPWGPGLTLLNPPPSGPDGSYWASDFRATGNLTTTGGTLSDWLLTPVVPITNGTTLTFFTRRADPEDAPERMQIRFSTAGASTSVGTNDANATGGDFAGSSQLLLELNPTQAPNGYPSPWQQFTLTVTGVPGLTTGRFAFRHFVLNAGLNAPNADVVGLDSVSIVGVPEPASWVLTGLAAAVGWVRWRRAPRNASAKRR
jgi:hypothetical protein